MNMQLNILVTYVISNVSWWLSQQYFKHKALQFLIALECSAEKKVSKRIRPSFHHWSNVRKDEDRKLVVDPAKKLEGGHGDINESLYACVGFLLKPLRTYWRQFWWRLSWLMIVKSLIKSFIMISQPIYSEINRSRYIFLCWDGL